jgi:hypothetical protein
MAPSNPDVPSNSKSLSGFSYSHLDVAWNIVEIAEGAAQLDEKSLR